MDDALQARLEGAAADSKATALATRKNKFEVPDEIRMMAEAAGKCGNPVLRRVLRKSRSPTQRENRAETNCENTLGQRTCQ